MSVDIILKDIEWDGVNKIRVPLEGGGTQDFSIGGGSANLQTKSKTYTPTTSQQTDTVSPDTGYDGLSSVNVTVNAMPSGTAGTPTATKGTVSNHSVSVTPSVTNTTGYITGGTKTGTSVSVSASELVSGSQTVAGNGTFDVTNLAQLIVDTPTMNLPSATSSTPTGTRRANLYPSTSQQYLNIPAGLNDTARYYQIIGMDLAPLNVTQNGTYTASTYDISGFNTVNVNVPTGGGASNFVTGTFTTGSSAGHTEITIPYSGSGYPVMCVVVVDGGAYVSGTTWYTSSQRYAIGQWTMTKSNMSTVPTYGTSGGANQGVTTWIYKNTSSTSYSRSSAMTSNVFSSSNASNTGPLCVRFTGNKTLSYYVNTSSYGLHPNITYRYYIVYSS